MAATFKFCSWHVCVCVCVPLRVAAEFAIFLQNRGGLGLVQQQQLSKLSTPNKVCQKFHEVNRARGPLPVVASTNDCKTSKPHTVTEYYRQQLTLTKPATIARFK